MAAVVSHKGQCKSLCVPVRVFTHRLHNRQPLQNPSRPNGYSQVIPNSVLNLVSNLASFVNGESLVVDGGLSIELPGSAATRLTGLEV